MISRRKAASNIMQDKIAKNKPNSISINKQSQSKSKSSKKSVSSSLQGYKHLEKKQQLKKERQSKLLKENEVREQYLSTKVNYAQQSFKSPSPNILQKRTYKNTSTSSQKTRLATHSSAYQTFKKSNQQSSSKIRNSQKKDQKMLPLKNTQKKKQKTSIYTSKIDKLKKTPSESTVGLAKQTKRTGQTRNNNISKNNKQNKMKRQTSRVSNAKSDKKFSLQTKPLKPITNIYVQPSKIDRLSKQNYKELSKQAKFKPGHRRSNEKTIKSNNSKIQKSQSIRPQHQKKQCDWSSMNSQQLSSMVMNL